MRHEKENDDGGREKCDAPDSGTKFQWERKMRVMEPPHSEFFADN